MWSGWWAGIKGAADSPHLAIPGVPKGDSVDLIDDVTQMDTSVHLGLAAWQQVQHKDTPTQIPGGEKKRKRENRREKEKERGGGGDGISLPILFYSFKLPVLGLCGIYSSMGRIYIWTILSLLIHDYGASLHLSGTSLISLNNVL